MNRRDFLIGGGFFITMLEAFRAGRKEDAVEYDVGPSEPESRTYYNVETGEITESQVDSHIRFCNAPKIELDNGGYIKATGKKKDLVFQDSKGNSISVAELAKLRDRR